MSGRQDGFALTRHAASEGEGDLRVTGEVTRPAGGLLRLNYRVLGDIAAVRLPAPALPERSDGLWKHTCFEAFITVPGGGYYEFNFSPSTRWAAYRFSGHRAGMAEAAVARPSVRGEVLSDGYAMNVTLALDALGDLPHDAPWRLAVSAILESSEGGRSFWALAHPPGEPDFHHPDGFVLDLPPPEPA